MTRQDYGTDPAFFRVVNQEFDFTMDLAANDENAKCPAYITPEMDSLLSPWPGRGSGWFWLNPPYAHIEPWVRKAYEESLKGAKVAVLIPASVGSEWWERWVVGKAQARLLRGRLTFEGETTPYPKDCALLLYRRGLHGVCWWDWRQEVQA